MSSCLVNTVQLTTNADRQLLIAFVIKRFIMRTIQLTHEEIETIKMALQYVYDRKLDIVSQNRKTLGEEATAKILDQANKYFDTQDVFDGERDV